MAVSADAPICQSQLMVGVLLGFHGLPLVELPVLVIVTLPVLLLLPVPLVVPVPVPLPVVEPVLVPVLVTVVDVVRVVLPVPVPGSDPVVLAEPVPVPVADGVAVPVPVLDPDPVLVTVPDVVRVPAAVTVVDAVLLAWPSLAGARSAWAASARAAASALVVPGPCDDLVVELQDRSRIARRQSEAVLIGVPPRRIDSYFAYSWYSAKEFRFFYSRGE